MVKVLIADDHALLRQGMRQVLSAEWPEFSIEEAETLDAALEILAASSIELALLDLCMPGMMGAESLRALRETYPLLKLVVVTGEADRTSILECLAAGIHGYVLKSGPVEATIQAIQSVLGGELYISPMLADITGPTNFSKRPTQKLLIPDDGLGPGRFTPRQQDVLRLLGQGQSTKEIARNLELGVGTVKIHLAAIYQKLNVRNRTEAAVLAAKMQS